MLMLMRINTCDVSSACIHKNIFCVFVRTRVLSMRVRIKYFRGYKNFRNGGMVQNRSGNTDLNYLIRWACLCFLFLVSSKCAVILQAFFPHNNFHCHFLILSTSFLFVSILFQSPSWYSQHPSFQPHFC